MIALACWMIAASAAQADPDFDTFFAEFSKQRDSVQSLEAKFTQESITPEETKKTTGTITYVKPRRIMFRYDNPAVTYLVDEQKVYQYDVKLKQLQILDLENDPQTEAFFLGFDDNTERLKQAYEISLFAPEEKACGTKGLQLAPKKFADDLTKSDRKEEKYFERVRIALDGKQLLPCHIEIVNDPESKVLISISDVKVNAPNAAKDLSITVPEGAVVIDNDDKLPPVGPGGEKFPRSGSGKPKAPAVSTQELKAP